MLGCVILAPSLRGQPARIRVGKRSQWSTSSNMPGFVSFIDPNLFASVSVPSSFSFSPSPSHARFPFLFPSLGVSTSAYHVALAHCRHSSHLPWLLLKASICAESCVGLNHSHERVLPEAVAHSPSLVVPWDAIQLREQHRVRPYSTQHLWACPAAIWIANWFGGVPEIPRQASRLLRCATRRFEVLVKVKRQG